MLAIKTTVDKEIFDAENRIMIYVNNIYQGEMYNGSAYYSSKRINDDGTVTVRTNFNQKSKAGDEIKIVLSEGKPGWSHSADNGEVLYQKTVTEEMIQMGELDLDFAIARQPDNRFAIKTTLSKEDFNSEKRIMIYLNGVYQGETYNGSAYYSTRTFNDNGTVTVKTNFNETPKVGDTVKVVLADGEPGWAHSVDTGELLYQATITEEMLK